MPHLKASRTLPPIEDGSMRLNLALNSPNKGGQR